jgi:hypothetical protein
MSKRKRREREAEAEQGNLFDAAELYPVRMPEAILRPIDLNLRIKTAMGRALKECPDSVSVVAARMSELTGREITVDALYAYTAPSKPDHDIGIVRFVAFVRATSAMWLWNLLVEEDGLIVLQGREAYLAQLGLMQQEHDRLSEDIRRLKRELGRTPVKVTSCVRRSPALRGQPPFPASAGTAGGKP